MDPLGCGALLLEVVAGGGRPLKVTLTSVSGLILSSLVFDQVTRFHCLLSLPWVAPGPLCYHGPKLAKIMISK